ncbi:tyrosine-type recombinase/integrase [Flavobacteriaceae bacterium Ap0902]|nr:tyrosine-type recombinase/integrase [Flavobacteriaceae bacterium Ap0902]
MSKWFFMWIDKYLEYLEVERNYSPLTISAYKKDLEQFSAFIDFKDLNEVTKSDVRSYMAALLALDLEEVSINRKLSSLKSFYKFLFELEEISKIPTAGIRNLKSPRKIIIPFSEWEMQKLLETEIFALNDWEGVRNRLIVELLYITGMRRAELVGLLWKDIDFANYQLKVKGKGSKDRIIPITKEVSDLFNHYKKLLKEEFEDIQDEVFVTAKNKNIYPKLVYKIVKSYLSLVSEKTKKSPHMLRHSFATHMLNNGAEINAIKEILGHSSLSATQIYTHSSIEKLKEVFNVNHPRNIN